MQRPSRRSANRLMVFVDLDNVRRFLNIDIYSVPNTSIPRLIHKIQEISVAAVKEKLGSKRYLAQMRFYHGWRQRLGQSAMPIRGDFLSAFSDGRQSRTIGLVTFAGDLFFGDQLLCETIHSPIHATKQDSGQKMVDTAIACDVMQGIFDKSFDVAIILSDDDDMLPVVFNAKALGIKVIVVRGIKRNIDHITNFFNNDILYLGLS